MDSRLHGNDTKNMFIDTHCHLQFSDFDADRAMVIGNAKKAGVKKFIVPGVDEYSSRQAIELSRKHPSVIFASVGFHPYEAQKLPDTSIIESLLTSLSTENHKPLTPPIVAIGECGLDYHIYKDEIAKGKKDNQKRLFEEQLLLAIKHHLPVIMHCRDAYEDFFSVIDGLPSVPQGVIHCFSGGLQELRMASERLLHIGIDGNVTYTKHLESVIPHIPLRKLLLETDAPYLTPIPHRGTRNESKYIPLIAKKTAEAVHISTKKIEVITTQNAEALFRL